MEKSFSGIVIGIFFLLVFVKTVQAEHLGKACETLADMGIPAAEITLAKSVPSGDYLAPDGNSYSVPAFCRIHGVAKPTPESTINFEVWMPLKGWNGRYYQHGQGGSGGMISFKSLAALLNEGTAAAATDDGHTKPDDLGSSWVFEGDEVLVDFGYRALKTTTDHAKAVIERFYGSRPQHNYFVGCSDGGRLAFMAAQRYPNDWDGILAGAPGNNRIAFSGGSTASIGQIWLNNPDGRIPPTKLPAIQRAALASCTADAHVVDGIATDPRHCPFDPAVMACTDEDNDDCLTGPQIETLTTIYSGPKNPRTGESIYPGWPSTTEADGNWKFQLTGGDWKPFWSDKPSDEPGWLDRARQFYRYFVYEDPNWNFRTLNLDSDLEYAKSKLVAGETMSEVLDAIDTDLSALRERGGKLMMYFGWADSGITPLGGIDYYQDVVGNIGSLSETQEFFRLYLVPGMEHCVGAAKGTNAFGQMPGSSPEVSNDADHNILRALEAWVERDIKPERIIATKYQDHDPAQGIEMTRPICSYPKIAKYKGSGSTSEASNFVCEDGVAPP